MIQLTLTSNVTGRVIKSSYTARQLLESNEIDIVEEMSKCNCDMLPRGETNVVECNCDDEWFDYTLVVGDV
ncbi:acetyltransferase [Sporosarcina sp. ACRSL]|uniref:acetyltransferase n=1 Tax=Sporosarcina sp. ACRSL TaxID=2918215 RepID=UPI001EF4E71E|nr:acetyltransferase [Sporosarcina sp. ACRSL]MCG7345357.1 acetyltransferase [Sporosarcina sp. ACRSL]